MQNMLLPMPRIDEVTDVTEDAIDDDDDCVDGLGVLRAVVGAWQSLIVDNDATTAG